MEGGFIEKLLTRRGGGEDGGEPLGVWDDDKWFERRKVAWKGVGCVGIVETWRDKNWEEKADGSKVKHSNQQFPLRKMKEGALLYPAATTPKPKSLMHVYSTTKEQLNLC